MQISNGDIVKAVKFALTAELDATPKPGLIDRRNSGAHTDMDYALMKRSIDVVSESIESFLKEAEPYDSKKLDFFELAERLKIVGKLAEQRIKKEFAVNTHNGALFCLGLTAVAFKISEREYVGETVSRLAYYWDRAKGTKGACVSEQYGLKGALDNAKEGYSKVFNEFLPYFREKLVFYGDLNKACVCTLIYIATRIDDTNLYVRGGKEGAEWAIQRLRELSNGIDSNGYIEKDIIQADEEFIKRRLSPGGSADMLALTVMINELIKE